MIYGYARVSTKGQAKDGNSLEIQCETLKKAGAEIIYQDAFTGTTRNRPELNRLMEQLQPGDTFITTKLDRIARSVTEGNIIINSILSKGCDVNILNMGVFDNGPVGKMMRNMLLVFAEFERDMIVQRTQEGKANARLKPDFREGRPNKFNRAQRDHAIELLKDHTYKEVENMTGISESTLYREVRKRKAAAVLAEQEAGDEQA